MYVPKHAREERPQMLYEAIERIRFGSLATYHGGRLHITHLPMMTDAARGRIIGHVAKANPQWRDAGNPQAIASFVGPHFYVSPNDYAAKDTTGEVVPTWNYIIVEARGAVTFFDEPERLRAVVGELTDRQESAQVHPWRIDDAPPEYIQSELYGIVGFEMAVESLVGAWKLSRNHDQADRDRVAAMMERSDDPAVRALADTLRRER